MCGVLCDGVCDVRCAMCCVRSAVCGVWCAVANTNVAFFPSDAWGSISESAQDLVANLIVVDPAKVRRKYGENEEK